MVLLCLFLLGFQGNTFYERYDSGLEKLDNRDYKGAIKDLETAISMRPEPSENARTYGVQLIPYFPYHNLAKAYIGVKDLDKAWKYLELAYAKGEDSFKSHQAIAGRMEMMQEVILNYKDDQKNQTNTVPKTGPAMLPVLEMFVLETYESAIREIERQLALFPNNQELRTLQDLARGFASRKREAELLRQQREEYRKNFLELVTNARRSLERQDWEEALQYYLAVLALDDENHEANLAIKTIRKSLEERGKTEEDFQKAYALANKGITQLQQEKARLEQIESRLISENKDLNSRLDQYKNVSDKPLAAVDVQWDVQPSKGKELTANIYTVLKASMPLIEAELFINNALINTWPIDQKNEYRTPVLANYKFDEPRNTLKLVVRTTDQEQVENIYPYNFQEPEPFLSKERQRFIILVLSAMVLALFASRQMRKRKAFRDRFNPYIAGAPVLDERMFYGRSPLLKQILNTLHNNSLMIYGERRIGKTSFLHRLHKVLPSIDDPVYRFYPVFIDLQGIREEDFFSSIEHEIMGSLETLGIKLEPAPDKLNARQFTSQIRKYINELKAICDKKPKLVLLLDEVDVMNNYSDHTNQQLRSVFMKGFAEHLVSVMAGINIDKQWKSEGSPWYNFFEQIELKPFSKNYANALITQPVNGVYHYSAEAIEAIMEKTGGKPYLIQKLCLNLVSHILVENRRKITVSDVDYVFEEIRKEFYGATNA